jgi:hypothetical protein
MRRPPAMACAAHNGRATQDSRGCPMAARSLGGAPARRTRVHGSSHAAADAPGSGSGTVPVAHPGARTVQSDRNRTRVHSSPPTPPAAPDTVRLSVTADRDVRKAFEAGRIDGVEQVRELAGSVRGAHIGHATQLRGGGGIRTHEGVAALPHFECGALGRAMRLHRDAHGGRARRGDRLPSPTGAHAGDPGTR